MPARADKDGTERKLALQAMGETMNDMNRILNLRIIWIQSVLMMIGIIGAFWLSLYSLSAADYPEECRLIIWTDDTDCSGETLCIYQLGMEYEPLQESICWRYGVEDELKNLDGQIDKQSISRVIGRIEQRVKKEQPYLVMDLAHTNTQSVELTVPAGVYLLVQGSPKNYLIQSSLVSVPYMNEEQDQWIAEREIHLKTREKPKPGNPNTGDEMKTVIWLAVLLISGLGIGILAKTKHSFSE